MQPHERHRHRHRPKIPSNLVLALLLLANVLAFYVLAVSGWFSVPKSAEPTPTAFSQRLSDEPRGA